MIGGGSDGYAMRRPRLPQCSFSTFRFDPNPPMSDIHRRDALKLIGLMAAAPTFSFSCTTQEPSESDAASQVATQPAADYERQFFTDHEFETVRVLSDLVIPADERSGSATDAGVPRFMDFVMTDEQLGGREAMEQRQTAMRGGLAWLDYQCRERFDALFVDCTEAQRRELLDLIAWPEDAPPDMEAGVEFFNSFRDLTASGFFSSRMGMEDVQYQGNTYVEEWTGCPDAVHEHIGLEEA